MTAGMSETVFKTEHQRESIFYLEMSIKMTFSAYVSVKRLKLIFFNLP